MVTTTAFQILVNNNSPIKAISDSSIITLEVSLMDCLIEKNHQLNIDMTWEQMRARNFSIPRVYFLELEKTRLQLLSPPIMTPLALLQ